MEKPWLKSKRWSRTVRSDAKMKMIAYWAFAVLCNLVAWPVLLTGAADDEPVVKFVFPIVGVVLVFIAKHQSRQWRRYGPTTLTLDPYPGAIGGHVGGFIDLARTAAAHDSYEATLQCVYTYYSGSGKSRSRHYDVIWEARGPVESSRTAHGARLAFRFEVPDGLPSSEKPRGAYHLWRLHLEGQQTDVPLDRTFEIAVFPTGAHSREVAAETTRAGEAAARRTLDEALVDSRKAASLSQEMGLSIEESDGRLRLVLHPGRQKILAALFGGIGIAFVGVACAAFDADVMTRWIFGLVGAIAAGVGLYMPFNSLDVRVSRTRIERVRSWFGFVIARQRVHPSQLRKLEIAQGSTLTINSRTTVYYQLVGKGSFGKFRLLESIPDRGLVEAIRDRILQNAGLRVSA